MGIVGSGASHVPESSGSEPLAGGWIWKVRALVYSYFISNTVYPYTHATMALLPSSLPFFSAGSLPSSLSPCGLPSAVCPAHPVNSLLICLNGSGSCC